MSDVVERLRLLYVQQGTNYVQEAADEIERLRAEVERQTGVIRRQNAKIDHLGIRLGEVIAERDELRLRLSGTDKR